MTPDGDPVKPQCWTITPQHSYPSVFQLGIFLRALRPARTALRPARLSSALPELFIKKNKLIFHIFYFFIFFYLKNVIADFVFSDSRCKNACNCLQICAHVFICRPQNCAKTSRFNRVLDCDRILVVRALDCAQFLLHPALFPT